MGDVDLAGMYRASRLRIGGLVDDDVADVPVPASEMWTVHDVVAHLVFGASDVTTGNLDGAGSPPWTAAHVERGRGETVADLLAAWEEHGANIEQLLASPQGSRASAVVMDVNCHECDLRHALGLAPQPDAGFLDWAAPSLLGGFAKAVEARSLPPVTVDAPQFEVFRGRLGRRTGAEVAGYAWSADPTEYLDAWFIFGPRDQPLGEAAPG